ncbi:hypothetical protein QC762_0106620 [Podospora pseudocomata]|uniref:Uncharacterized protein n=1 Tax=Podospora pseudocomata TaxID=2093779 RepID=A0ABR0G2Z1_9PEZI|nr:hypothetical protein QC762_0106620 [Podospora pseudocomata]
MEAPAALLSGSSCFGQLQVCVNTCDPYFLPFIPLLETYHPDYIGLGLYEPLAHLTSVPRLPAIVRISNSLDSPRRSDSRLVSQILQRKVLSNLQNCLAELKLPFHHSFTTASHIRTKSSGTGPVPTRHTHTTQHHLIQQRTFKKRGRARHSASAPTREPA